jgi:hypothetical protein
VDSPRAQSRLGTFFRATQNQQPLQLEATKKIDFFPKEQARLTKYYLCIPYPKNELLRMSNTLSTPGIIPLNFLNLEGRELFEYVDIEIIDIFISHVGTTQEA